MVHDSELTSKCEATMQSKRSNTPESGIDAQIALMNNDKEISSPRSTVGSENKVNIANAKILRRKKIEYIQISKRVASQGTTTAATPINALKSMVLDGFAVDRKSHRDGALSSP